MAVEVSVAQPALQVAIVAEADLILVRQTLRAASEQAGLGLVDQTRLITAGSELARNILTHTRDRRGRMAVEQVSTVARRGVRATFDDDGPGIPDLALALTDGYSTAGSLGLGLPGARRLVDELQLDSAPDRGTTVMIVKWGR